MWAYKKIKIIFTLAIFIVIFLISYTAYTIQKNKGNTKSLVPISINLITSIHPDLPWTFKVLKSKVVAHPGEVISIEYQVENISEKKSTGLATFAYYPRSFGPYIIKLNCFCYDEQSLEPKEKLKYTLTFLLDPEVTKNSKTKKVKEVTIQFTFFDYKKYKKIKN